MCAVSPTVVDGAMLSCTFLHRHASAGFCRFAVLVAVRASFSPSLTYLQVLIYTRTNFNHGPTSVPMLPLPEE